MRCPFIVLAAALLLQFQLSGAFTTTALSDARQASSRLFQRRGDPLREATGIRPSLHPLTINTIAEALKLRANKDPDVPLSVVDGVEPLHVALTAGRIAAEAIQKRQESSEHDGMSLTAEEQQTVAGRVVGVVMRLRSLEIELVVRCKAASWVAKYEEFDSFGILKEENEADVDDRIKTDPLFTMNRAECLLALFLDQVEAPELESKKAVVGDGSKVDFLDADRKEVLLGS